MSAKRDASPRHPRGEEDAADSAVLRARHLRIGWWSVLIFLGLGLALESLHGWKIGWYLDVSNETRRLMFTLAHAHGALVGIVHVVFALSLAHLRGFTDRGRRAASYCLTAGGLLLPGGFFLGGLVTHAGDPGLGILLVPIGALLLLTAVALTARAARGARNGAPES